MMLFFLCLEKVGEARKYNYVVQIINPTWKSLFSVRNWHHVNGKFSSPDVLKMKLMETFAEAGRGPGNKARNLLLKLGTSDSYTCKMPQYSV